MHRQIPYFYIEIVIISLPGRKISVRLFSLYGKSIPSNGYFITVMEIIADAVPSGTVTGTTEALPLTVLDVLKLNCQKGPNVTSLSMETDFCESA